MELKSNLIFQTGDAVMLSQLRRMQFNGKLGSVLGFDEPSQRYIVKVHDSGTPIKVRAKNLIPILSAKAHELINRISDLALTPNSIKQLFLIVHESEDSKLGHIHVLYHGMWRLSQLTSDFHVLEKMLKILQEALSLPIPEPEEVLLKISICQCLSLLKMHAECEKIALSIGDRHFGRGPDILLTLASTALDHETRLDYVNKIIQFIISGNHGIEFDVISALDMAACSMWSIPEIGAKFMKMVVDIMERSNKAPEWLILRMKAMKTFAEGTYEKSLCFLAKETEIVVQTLGVEDEEYGTILYFQGLCYSNLNYTSQAKKCLKKLKRMENSARTRELEAKIEGMIINRESLARISARVKCSNPHCANVEKKRGEFQVCAKCRVAVYCSRKCQKRHWKRGHKKNCAGNAGIAV